LLAETFRTIAEIARSLFGRLDVTALVEWPHPPSAAAKEGFFPTVAYGALEPAVRRA